MNAFDSARQIETQSLKILRPFIQQRAFNGQYVVTSKGPLARELQKTVGDILYNADEERVFAAEIKAELENKHGNFFLETWSNLSRFTAGWMVTLNTDVLLYHFVKQDELYVIPYKALRKWAFCDGKIYRYPERRQSKYDQLNDTWGRCVPIDDVCAAVNVERFSPLAAMREAA